MNRHRNDVLDAIHALMHGPRTASELGKAMGATENAAWVWVNRLRRAGLIYIAGRRLTKHGKRGARVWAMQPKPFHYPDLLTTPYRDEATK